MSDSILDERPEEAVRRLAIGFLDGALAAAARVAMVAEPVPGSIGSNAADPEALHDMRVALRRLRSTLRAYRDVLDGAIPGKRRRALGELARATNSARDAEVQLAWTEALAVEPTERVGRDQLAAMLAAQRLEGYRALHERVLPALTALLPKIREDLLYYSIRHTVFERPPKNAFRVLIGQLVRAELAELGTTLRAARGPDAEVRAHEARISGKRIRYLLEPFKDALGEVAAAVKTLRTLQEILGRLNDLSVRTRALGVALDETARLRARQLVDDAQRSEQSSRRSSHGQLAAPGPAEPETGYAEMQDGLIAILKRVLGEKEDLLLTIEREWLNGTKLELFEDELSALIALLSQPDAPREIERKYLLRAVPPEARTVAARRIDQGYLPGQDLIERVRRIASADGERFVRTVKLGRGVSRIEVEEACGRDVFEKLWALTLGRRVQKNRYALVDGGHTWEIDEFTDRELVLAEVELASETDMPAFPSWLAPYVVRDVTDEPAFVNAVLAK